MDQNYFTFITDYNRYCTAVEWPTYHTRIYPVLQAVQYKSTTSFTCYSDSLVDWFHNGRYIAHGTKFGNTFFIVGATRKDRGSYQCMGDVPFESLVAHLYVAGE